jgi:hypothetical protein
MIQRVTQLLTTGEIAARLGQPIHRVDYVVRARGIRPAARAGRLRVFGTEAIAQIQDAIDAADDRRGAVQ